jgi:hypothetical protein
MEKNTIVAPHEPYSMKLAMRMHENIERSKINDAIHNSMAITLIVNYNTNLGIELELIGLITEANKIWAAYIEIHNDIAFRIPPRGILDANRNMVDRFLRSFIINYAVRGSPVEHNALIMAVAREGIHDPRTTIQHYCNFIDAHRKHRDMYRIVNIAELAFNACVMTKLMRRYSSRGTRISEPLRELELAVFANGFKWEIIRE